MKRHLKKKQYELLHNVLGVLAAELADVEDSLYQGNSAVRMHKYNRAQFGSSVSLYR